MKEEEEEFFERMKSGKEKRLSGEDQKQPEAKKKRVYIYIGEGCHVLLCMPIFFFLWFVTLSPPRRNFVLGIRPLIIEQLRILISDFRL